MKTTILALAGCLSAHSASALPPLIGTPADAAVALSVIAAAPAEDENLTCTLPVSLEAHVPVGDAEGKPSLFAVARATVFNMTNKAVTLSLPFLTGSTPRFCYKLCDASGHVYWSSSEPAEPRVVTQTTLRKHEAWTDSVVVPLVSERGYLLAGRYNLVVSIAGAPHLQTSYPIVVGQ